MPISESARRFRDGATGDDPPDGCGDEEAVGLADGETANPVLMCQRVAEVPADIVLEIIRRCLQQASPTSSTADDFLIDVCASGMLVERELGQFAFAHFSFQEYLASTHIRDKQLTAALVDNVDDPWWRQTSVLYAASGSADQIVRACLAAASAGALSLALSCADVASHLSRDVRDSLRTALSL